MAQGPNLATLIHLPSVAEVAKENIQPSKMKIFTI